MKTQISQSDTVIRQREEHRGIQLHYNNGMIVMDNQTLVPAGIYSCYLTVYTQQSVPDERCSDMLIASSQSGKFVWFSIEDRSNHTRMMWDSRSGEVDVTVIMYLQTGFVESFVYCSSNEQYSLNVKPKTDPRMNHNGFVSNKELVTNYLVMSKLLEKSYPYCYKCMPMGWEG